MDLRALDFRQDLKILVMFLIVQFFGILIATQIYNGLSLVQLQSYQTSSSVYSPIYYIITIAFIALIIVILFKSIKGKKLLFIFEAIAVLIGSFYFFGFILEIFINNFMLVFFLSLILAVLTYLFKRKYKGFRNIATMIMCIGLGVIIGIGLPFYLVIILMFLLAAYDFIMVFITKYMITMGQAAMDMNLALLVAVGEAEAVPKSELKSNEVKQYEEHKKKLKEYPKILNTIDKKGYIPIYGQRALGNGDMALPLVVAVSAYAVYQSFLFSLFIVIGGTIGLILTFLIQVKYRKPLPAIPPLLFGILIMMFIYYIIFIIL
ncbi:MAG: presenilin family intramembrane aspartyl protease [Candidatus Marsarchaeota archaeon]|jgi:presenilin-like A22 family membrane protease|nr:presenilin family intramembrane aspartyl protease [Candidatus Marsarchaeota archaeon]